MATGRRRGAAAPGSKRSIAAAEKLTKALELRRSGATYDKIAQECGWANRGTAYKAIRDALANVRTEAAEGALEEELDRLDAMLTGLWNAAKRGNVAAVDRVLRIMDRRARYLGLNAPEKAEISGPDGQPMQIITDPEQARTAALEAIATARERAASTPTE